MGISLTIFSLYRIPGEGDVPPRHLLLRVRQAGFRNADASEYDFVFDGAEDRRQALLAAYSPAAPVTARLVGELQSRPVGDTLGDGPGSVDVELWVAQTRHGAPWIVLGTAKDEKAFWRAVAADEELSGLGPVRPAERVRAHFLADDECAEGWED